MASSNAAYKCSRGYHSNGPKNPRKEKIKAMTPAETSFGQCQAAKSEDGSDSSEKKEISQGRHPDDIKAHKSELVQDELLNTPQDNFSQASEHANQAAISRSRGDFSGIGAGVSFSSGVVIGRLASRGMQPCLAPISNGVELEEHHGHCLMCEAPEQLKTHRFVKTCSTMKRWSSVATT